MADKDTNKKELWRAFKFLQWTILGNTAGPIGAPGLSG